MGGGSKQQTSTIQLPAWVEAASLENYNFAKDVANRPYQPYTGNTVADFSPDQYAAFDYARNNTGAYQGAFDDALGMAYNSGNSLTPYVNGNYGAMQVNAPTANGYYEYDPARENYSSYMQSAVNPNTYDYKYNPQNVQAQSFKDANVSDYMNPYLDQVESYALQNLQAGTQQGLNKIGDQAAAAGAFGGSRQGVQEGTLMGDAAKRAGELSANVRAQGFDKAVQQITADQNRNLQGQMANQAAGLQNAGYGLQAGLANMQSKNQAQELNRNTDLQLAGMAQRANLANQAAGMDINRLDQAAQFANQQALMQAQIANQGAGMDLNRLNLQSQMANQTATANDYARQLSAALGMGQLGTSANANIGTDLARLLSTGGMQQEQEQKYLMDAYSRFMEAQNYPLEQLNTRLAALGMSPYGRTQTTTSSGGGADIGGILGGAGSAAMGLAKLLPLLASSDETAKTDISKVGKDKATGLPVYSYRYKGDPKSYPKVVGLMAQDIEDKMPDQVVNVGGKKAVKFDPKVPANRIIKSKKA